MKRISYQLNSKRKFTENEITYLCELESLLRPKKQKHRDDLEKFLHMRASGMTYAEIAKSIGKCNKAWINHMVKHEVDGLMDWSQHRSHQAVLVEVAKIVMNH